MRQGRCPGGSDLHADIHGNREFVAHLRNQGKFVDHEEKRERDLTLIDYADPGRNLYEVTEEWAFHNGHHGTREDIVFRINGIPVLVIECKNATKNEAIALRVDQTRRYHRETPELFVPQQLFTATEDGTRRVRSEARGEPQKAHPWLWVARPGIRPNLTAHPTESVIPHP